MFCWIKLPRKVFRGSSPAGPPGAGWPGADPSSGAGFLQGWSLHGVAVPEQRHPPRKTGNFLVVQWNFSCSCLSLVALAHSGAATEEILTLSSPPLRCWHCPGSSCAEISLLQAEHSQLLASPRDAPRPCPSPWARSRVFLSCPGNAQHWTQQWGRMGRGNRGGFSQKLPEAPCWTHHWPELDPSGMVGAPLG